jgi:hypothetical protein
VVSVRVALSVMAGFVGELKRALIIRASAVSTARILIEVPFVESAHAVIKEMVARVLNGKICAKSFLATTGTSAFRLMKFPTTNALYVHLDSQALVVPIANLSTYVSASVLATEVSDVQTCRLALDATRVHQDLKDHMLRDSIWKPSPITHFRDSAVTTLTNVGRVLLPAARTRSVRIQ